MDYSEQTAATWGDALAAAALFAVDPQGLGGICLRARAGPVRDRWLATLHALLPPGTVVRRLPIHIDDSRLLGGLDLSATLQAGRPVAERGLLADCHQGVVVVPMAERLPAAAAGRLAAALDSGSVRLERDGFAHDTPARLAVVALDEGIEADERPPAVLCERLALHADLDVIPLRDATGAPATAADVAAARARLSDVAADDRIVEALCGAGAALGVASLRAVWLAFRAARAAAALAGRESVEEEDVVIAARLVLAPRATTIPAPPAESEPADDPGTPEAAEPQSPDERPDEDEGKGGGEDRRSEEGALEDLVVAAAAAAIPSGLLAALRAGAAPRSGGIGRAGAMRQDALRGRPYGVRRGSPRSGARLNLVETLRAAAPWQRLRRSSANGDAQPGGPVVVRSEDFRVARYRERSETTTIFAVDASGSSALHRLAEAKGAVELLLADCYVRRDQVALVAFRGTSAEVVLPPTRSLARAKRSLAGIPGGGATPLAAGIDLAAGLADAVLRRGRSPTLILLTDGRANVARKGAVGRAEAEADARQAARAVRAARLATLLVDTAPRPRPFAAELAGEMAAAYLALPEADAATLSRAIRGAEPGRARAPLAAGA